MMDRITRNIKDLGKEVKNIYKKRLTEYSGYILLIIICLALSILALHVFLELSDDLLDKELKNFDKMISTVVYGLRSEWLTGFMSSVTVLGDRTAYIIIIVIIAIILYFRWHNWKLSLQVVIVLIIASAANRILKDFFQRTRPEGNRLIEVTSLSFPSGHAMSSIAFYGFLIYLTWMYVSSMALKILYTALLLFLILSIGLSRIYLGVHYPSDVLAGYAAGLFFMVLCIIIFNGFRLYRRRKKNRN